MPPRVSATSSINLLFSLQNCEDTEADNGYGDVQMIIYTGTRVQSVCILNEGFIEFDRCIHSYHSSCFARTAELTSRSMTKSTNLR